ncbi:Serine/threonine-protein phosphatase 7 long form [Glycine max]|nr:Serine/threonine-protein phosphatase 7 long form [Glycine max]
MYYGCKISMFHNMFGMGKKIKSYILDELSTHIKVKKKLFIYLENLCLDRKMKAENTYFSHEMRRVHYYSSGCLYFIPYGWVTLAHHFPELNNHDGNLQQVEKFTCAWILRFIGDVLFVDKGNSKVLLRYLQFLRDFRECNTYAWGPTVLAYLHREKCSATDYKIKSIEGMCILIQIWAWEQCTSLAPKRTSPLIENKPLGHRWLGRGNQHIGNDDLIVFRHKLDIMKRHEFVWEPYTANIMLVLPPICLVGSVAWCAVVPLICFQVIE